MQNRRVLLRHAARRACCIWETITAPSRTGSSCSISTNAISSLPTGMRSPPAMRTPRKLEEYVWTHGDRLARRGPQSRRRDPVHPVQGARACRIASAAVDDHAAGLAGARAVLQGSASPAGGSGSEHLRIPRISLAAVGGHLAVPIAVRAGRRGPSGACGDHARGCAALQSHLRPRAGVRAEGREGDQEPGLRAIP